VANKEGDFGVGLRKEAALTCEPAVSVTEEADAGARVRSGPAAAWPKAAGNEARRPLALATSPGKPSGPTTGGGGE
jgi:hypothetical protein